MSHTVGGTPTNYTWDVNAGLPVVLQDGTNTYVYGLDLISATDAAGNQTYFTYDGLGSTTGLTDDTGAATDTHSYDVFGAIRSQTGSSVNAWLFTGEQRDADSGLYFLRARYYDATSGRFLGRDPVMAAEPYAYVGGNPVNLVDPYGLFGLKDLKKAAGQVAGTVVDAVGSDAFTAASCGISPVVPVALGGCAISSLINPHTRNYVLTGVQVADILPLGNVPLFGQAAGIVLDLGAFLALEYQILQSGCPWQPLTLANLSNLGIGILGNLGGPLTVNQTSAIEAVGFGATAAYMESCDSVASGSNASEGVHRPRLTGGGSKE
jgi:RHS repeat-associated protein